MTSAQFKSVLDSTGIPFCYHHWEEPHDLPFGAWAIDGEDDFKADNESYIPVKSAYVEYYSQYKDFAAEDKIKAALKAAGIPYSFVNEQYIESEPTGYFMTRWGVEFISTNGGISE